MGLSYSVKLEADQGDDDEENERQENREEDCSSELFFFFLGRLSGFKGEKRNAILHLVSCITTSPFY